MLALLIAVSLILLTAYFGESPSSPLHSVQRGIVQVLSPIQEGASKVLSPVRDVAGWFSDTFKAKSQVSKLKAEVQTLQAEVAQYKGAWIQNQQYANQLRLDAGLTNFNAYHAVSGSVISRDPSLWYATIEVDKGSADGVRLNDPVMGDGALVGKVTTVDPNVSIVTLLTDHSYAVSAEVLDQFGDTGVLVPAVGNPNQLLLQDLPPHAPIANGMQVVTAGFKDGSLDSLYPANIPIGTVSNYSQDELLNSDQVQVTPSADLRHLDVVQILTTPHAGTERAQVP